MTTPSTPDPTIDPDAALTEIRRLIGQRFELVAKYGPDLRVAQLTEDETRAVTRGEAVLAALVDVLDGHLAAGKALPAAWCTEGADDPEVLLRPDLGDGRRRLVAVRQPPVFPGSNGWWVTDGGRYNDSDVRGWIPMVRDRGQEGTG